MAEVLTEVAGVRIAGRTVTPIEGTSFEVVEPATGAPIARVEGGGARDAMRAAEVAGEAFAGWGGTPALERARVLRRIADAVDGLAEGSLAEIVTRETGKRLEEARAEIRFSARYFEWFADVISTSPGQVWDVVPGVRHFVRWRPLGVVAVMTPWNFPVSIPARKIAPALAAGCTVVFRPSQYTPQSSLGLVAGIEHLLPPGVLNTVSGRAGTVSNSWLDDPRVAGLSFTGSTEVGRHLAAEAGRRLKMATLELGGRAPFVVCADADLEQAVEALVVAKYRNNGESCIAANNVWVHQSLWEEFVPAYLERNEKARVGNPLEDDVDLGPVRKAEDVSRLEALAEEAGEAGAEVVVGGGDAPEEGFYVRPTVCLEPPPSLRVWRDEVFGPLTPIRPFASLEEVVEDSNASHYGLAGYVMSRDEDGALDLASRLEIGLVGINLSTPNTPQIPFGGLKASGFGGYEGGWAGLEPFIEYQSIAVRRDSGQANDR